MKPYLRLCFLLVLTLLSSCAHEVATVDATTSRFYTTSFTPNTDAARVYVLPTLSKGLLTDLNGEATIAVFRDGSDKGHIIGSTGANVFVAFDIGPGIYTITAFTNDPFSKTAQSMTFEKGKVYFLRPSFFKAVPEIKDKITYAGAENLGMHFETVDRTLAEDNIRTMLMSALDAEGEKFLLDTIKTPQINAAETSIATPQETEALSRITSTAHFKQVETKLRELKQLHYEGLISDDEYARKRDTILKAY